MCLLDSFFQPGQVFVKLLRLLRFAGSDNMCTEDFEHKSKGLKKENDMAHK